MASTNNGKLNGKSNLSKGTGIGAAAEQQNVKRDYTNEVFKQDTGYLANSIKALKEQSKYYEEQLKNAENLSKTEAKRFKQRLAEADLLLKQQQEAYDKREAREADVVKSIRAQHKLNIELLEARYKKEFELIDKVDEAKKEAQKQATAAIAAEIAEAKEIFAEFEDAANTAKEATYTMKDGLNDTISSINNAAGEFTKIFSLHEMATNDFLEIAQERYDIMNKLNQQLGYGASQSTSAYNSIVGKFDEFNQNIDGLFNMDDMKSYLSRANELGMNNQTALEDNLKATLTAETYLGLSAQSTESLYKYMRLTNNNEAINKYNKTMIALQKQGISVNTDMYNQMIADSIEATDVMKAAGMSNSDIEAFNSERELVLNQIGAQYGPEHAEQLSSMMNTAIENLGSEQGLQQLTQMGVNPFELESALQDKDATEFLDTLIEGLSKMSPDNDSMISNMLQQGYLGLNTSDINTARLIGADGINNLVPSTQELIDSVNSMSDQEAEAYVQENIQMNDINQVLNKLETWATDTFGGWVNFETLGTAAFAMYLASGGVKAITSTFGKNGSLSKLLSGISTNTAATAKNAGTVVSNTGKSGALASGIASVAIGITAGLGIANAIKSGVEGMMDTEIQDETLAAANNLKGTSLEGNSTAASIQGFSNASANKGMDALGSAWNTTTRSIGVGLLGWTRGVGDINRDDYRYFQEKMQFSQSLSDRDRELYNIAWGLLLMSAGRQGDVSEYSSWNASELSEYFSQKGYTKSDINAYVKAIVDDNTLPEPNKTKDDDQETIDWSKLNIDGYHKAGLENVPRDNYRALLHKNEMVLTEDEAKEYKHIMDRALAGKMTDELASDYRYITNQDYATQGGGIGGKGTFGIGGGGADYSYKPYSITAGYPYYPSGGAHKGVDFGTPRGTPIGSTTSGTVYQMLGTVTREGWKGNNSDGGGWGNYVRIKDKDGKIFTYAHLQSTSVTPGMEVGPGTMLGLSGNTGNSTGPHLHYQVNDSQGGLLDPYNFFSNSMWSIGDSTGVTGTTPGTATATGSVTSVGNIESTIAKTSSLSRRAVPGIGGVSSLPTGPTSSSNDQMIEALNGVPDKIIKYLDSIRDEQTAQRKILNAFAASQSSI